jgi:GT2 family glycosyltransferase
MNLGVSAVVLTHDQPQLLERVLAQLKDQTVKPNRILVVDTSKNPTPTEFETLRLNPRSNFAVSIEAAVKHLATDGYLWLLHDDSAPEPKALERLLREVELSPSLAVVGPKQVEWDNPKIIKQLGLTLTRSGRLFSRVRGEFDQGQYDNFQDVMAVGTAGALINLESYRSLGGFDSKAPALAADVDFSIRARLSGSRVAVAPTATLSHAMLSLSGQRPFSWLGTFPSAAIRHAELHLKLSYSNPLVFLLQWLLLLPAAIFSSLLLVVRKRAAAVPGELTGALLAFVGVGRILSSRSKIAKTTSAGLSSLRELRATRAELKTANARARDAAISRQLLDAHSRGVSDELEASANSGLVSSGAIWWALLLVGLNFAWFPTNLAATGGGLIPLGQSWLDIFNQAGSNSHSFGLGYSGVSDPFVWALAILSAPTFFAPTLSITLLLYLATALAFIAAFKFLGLFSSSNPVRIITALSYALFPAISLAQGEVRFNQVMAAVLLPWLVLALGKIAGLGKFAAGQHISSWSQVGLAAVLLALIAALSPLLGMVLVTLSVLLGLVRPRKLIPLIFVSGLTAAWFLPLLAERSRANPLTIILDPGIGQPSIFGQNWSLLFVGFGLDQLFPQLLGVAVLILFALLAVLLIDPRAGIGLWLVAFLALAASYLAVGINIDFGGSETLGIDPHATLALYGLMLASLIALAADSKRWYSIAALGSVALLVLAPAGYWVASNPPAISYSDGRVVPSIVQADFDSGTNFRTLRLSRFEDAISAEVFYGDGIGLHELSSGYQLERSQQLISNPDYLELGQLVANLASANGANLVDSLIRFNIGYILVSDKDRDLQMALDSTAELESIGETDFGQLWKVRSANALLIKPESGVEAAKLSQLVVLGFYLVLAIPTSRRRSSKDSEIFVDSEENN